MTLLPEIEKFCATHEMTDGQFGILALNDKNFVGDLREGRDVRMSTASKVRDFMLTYRPQDAAA